MSRVLITQIGLVAIVEQPPALNEAYTLARKRLSIHDGLAVFDNSSNDP